MKKLIIAIMAIALSGLAPKTLAQDLATYNKVANQLVELINASAYSGVENLFNKDMSAALPPDKASQFFRALSGQYGKIIKLEAPKRNAGWQVFPAHCDHGLMDMSVALDHENKIAGLYFKLRPTTAGMAEAPAQKQVTELSLPFKGRWVVFWGGDTLEVNHHHDVPAQKFAFDILGMDESGKTHSGDGFRNEEYFCFGREILAPADGVVVEAIDGVRDNQPGSMNPYCLVGNCVVIQHRTNEFSVLAHFQRGSVAVKAGGTVKRGQLLGKCGNSGNSSEPHLHYHLQNSAIFQDAFGIKVRFQNLSVTRDGKTESKSNYSPVKGDIISAD
jgi:murein DD-endopeptidase MepM/ murein hydrolase activator NlpD